MEKKYDLVFLNNHSYMVDNEYPVGGKFMGISEREGPVFGDIKSFQNNHINGDGSITDRTGWNTAWYYPKVPIGVFHIIASDDHSLGLPLLPKVENIEQMAVAHANTDKQKEIFKWNSQQFIDSRIKPSTNGIIEGKEKSLQMATYLALAHANNMGYEAGYNAASKKEYTKEDMIKAYELGKERKQWELDDDGEDGSQNPYDIQKLIISYAPKPVAVKVEMDRIPADLAPNGWDVFPKTKDNIIIVKRWIHE